MTGQFVRATMTPVRNAGNNASDSIDNDVGQLLLMFAPKNAPTSVDVWPQCRGGVVFQLKTPRG